MNKPVFLVTLGLAGACTAQAQETGRVVSSTPVIAQVAVPRQVCNAQPVAGAPATSGAGSLIGAVAGGILGSTVGGGMGQAAAIALGAAGGAVVGNHVEAGTQGHGVQMAQHCRIENIYENRTVGYNVSYEWGGKTYTAQMPYDPGPTVTLQVAPVGAGSIPPAAEANLGSTAGSAGVPILRSYQGVAPAGPAGTVDAPHYPLAFAPPVGTPLIYPAPVVYPAPVYYGAPLVPAYAVRPYYPPVGISFNFGYSRGWGHRHRGHGRWRH